MFYIIANSIPVGAPYLMYLIDQYLQPLRHSLNTISKEALDVWIGDTLLMAVKAISNSIGSDGPVPMLPSFGA